MPDNDAPRCPLALDQPEVLLEWAAQRLPESQTLTLEAHFQTCPECREFANAQRSVWSALDDWEPEAAALDFQHKLYERIEREERSLARRLRKPAIPAAALAAAFFLVALLPREPAPPLPVPEPAALESLEQQAADLAMLAQWPAATESAAEK